MPIPRKARVFSWALYDYANTMFSMNMLSMYFPLWITQEMGGKDIYYSIALSISVVAAGAVMPIIGAVSDRRKSRMPFLIVLTLLCISATAAISLSSSLFLALALFSIANFGYQAALAPYDSLLPEVSEGVNIGRVSGLGVGLGYLGSIGGLMMVKPFVDSGGRSGAFLPTAILFLVFALPCFLFVKEHSRRKPKKSYGIKREFKKIFLTLKNTRRYPGLLRFLVANIIYSDAVNTVIVFMAVYASKAIGMDDKSIRTFLIVSTVFAAVGSFVAGKVTDWLGPKRALMQALLLWAVTMLIACFSFSKTVFWAVGPLAGISLGSTWVASRALVARLSPPRKFGEIYGLYNLGGKFGFVLGPLVWGGIVLAFEPLGIVRYRIAIFSLLMFILVAMYVLKKVKINDIKEVAPDAGTIA